jgi:arsenite methyltransferase
MGHFHEIPPWQKGEGSFSCKGVIPSELLETTPGGAAPTPRMNNSSENASAPEISKSIRTPMSNKSEGDVRQPLCRPTFSDPDAETETRSRPMSFTNLAVFLLVVVCPLLSQDSVRRTSEELHHLHQDSKAYIAFLEDPQRDAYQKPREVMTALGIKPGEVIADIGAGSGYFTFQLARQVGVNGRVYAVDINPDMIIYINRRIRDSNTRNLVTILAPPDDPLLPDTSVDRFFICDTWHHIEKQDAYLALMKKALKPGGQVVMIDFQKKELPVGPPLNMKIGREDLIRQMDQNGFVLVQEHTFLPYQYFLVFQTK